MVCPLNHVLCKGCGGVGCVVTLCICSGGLCRGEIGCLGHGLGDHGSCHQNILEVVCSGVEAGMCITLARDK